MPARSITYAATRAPAARPVTTPEPGSFLKRID